MTAPSGTSGAENHCPVCGSDEFAALVDHLEFPLITSDCRVWGDPVEIRECASCATISKRVTRDWQASVAEIYSTYAPYQQAGGAEQKIRADANSFVPRSTVLVDRIRQQIRLPPTGTLLDIGCGNGVFLRAFADRHPGWHLVGNDVGAHFKTVVEAISPRARYVGGAAESLTGRFDLVSMVHVLEHVFEPGPFLRQVDGLLAAGGACFVQVPNVVQNPFDLVIFDHVTHFSPDGLARLGRSVFGEALHVSTAWNPKEVSMLAGAGIGRSEPWASARPAPFGLVDMVNWLKSVVADARAARRNGTRLGIFGTSIAGTWLAAALDAFDFFVDEDEARIGHSYMGRPVLHPADARGPVYVPFGPEMARGIANRLSSLGIDSVVPGPLAGLDRCQ